MTKWFLLLLMVLASAPAAVAQDSDYKRYEFYGGYAYQRVNDNSGTIHGAEGPISFRAFGSRDQAYNGVTAEFNQNPWRHVGLVTSFTVVYDNTPYVDTGVEKAFTAKARRYDLLFGPRYNFRLGRFNPFVEGMAGFEHLRVTYGDALPTNHRVTDTAFAMALGGGVDVHVSEHFDIRAIQADYVPTFFNGSHQNNYRVGAGLKVKFIDP